eukprot:TRINITY_DN11149_c0_g1_i3.p1 TRINITY_DN11149_c0_g1~~TRINITY_DN11149_c0_g1_i3.p1  ORF type:complete len:299 (+),score=29.65 TRINITY_DN11149_c0_g1_i3:267-1163(+)
MVFGNASEIIEKFGALEVRYNSSIIFNAEPYCYPSVDGLCDDSKYPASPTFNRFLNSGLFVGRARALRELLRDPVPDSIPGGDQEWYQRRFRDQYTLKEFRQGPKIELDRHCELVCVVVSVDPKFSEHFILTADKRMQKAVTGVRPPLVHFPGVGHWPKWVGEEGQPSNTNMDLFQAVYPSAAKSLLENWKIELHLGSTHTIPVYDGPGFWSLMRLVLCIQCNLLGSKVNECESFVGLTCYRCAGWTFGFFGLQALLLSLCCCCWRQRRCLDRGSVGSIIGNRMALRISPEKSDEFRV